jgi:hypothetical protein
MDIVAVVRSIGSGVNPSAIFGLGAVKIPE